MGNVQPDKYNQVVKIISEEPAPRNGKVRRSLVTCLNIFLIAAGSVSRLDSRVCYCSRSRGVTRGWYLELVCRNRWKAFQRSWSGGRKKVDRSEEISFGRDADVYGYFSSLNEASIAIKVPLRLEVTCARHSTAPNVDIVDRDVLTASVSTKDVVITTVFRCSSSKISNRNALD